MSWKPDFLTQNHVPSAVSTDLLSGQWLSNHASGKVSGASAEGALGNRREYFHPEGGEDAPNTAKKANKTRLETLADTRQAARIFRANEARIEERGGDTSELAGRGVCFCGWHQIRDMESEVQRVRKQDRWHSYVTGVQMCGLRWVCPVCTTKKAEEDRKFVNDGLAAARAIDGIWPVMLTLTTRHTRREKASDVLQGVVTAEQRVKRLKVWDRIKDRSLGYVRAFEWTYGENGHHPHFHTILLIRAETEEEAIHLVEEMKPAYMRQLARVGRDGTSAAAWRHSFQVQGAAEAANYVAKWGAAEEITQAHKKDGKGEGLTPWQLLRRSRTLDDAQEREKSAAVWWEIIQASKGRAQLYKSEHFKRLVEEYRESHQAEAEPEPETVLKLGQRIGREGSLRFQLYRMRTLAVREAAESADDLVAAKTAAELALNDGDTDRDSLDRHERNEMPEVDLIDDRDFFEPTAPLVRERSSQKIPYYPPNHPDSSCYRKYHLNE